MRDLRIGQPADLDLDMYGSRQVFKGRISGFTMGTGSTLALLPAQNATGNFIKVVQRLPVRVELVNYDPDKSRCSSASRSFRSLHQRARRPGRTPESSCSRICAICHVPRRPSRERDGSHDRGGAGARPSGSRAINPWLVAIAVVVPTFMEVLDTTIANVALRYIAGGLSATVDDSEWVITSYLAANAIILPITGWLSAHLGRRNYFLLSIAVFTLASGLCGIATSLGH